MPKITPFLWFDKEAEEAAKFYVSVFPNSKITHTNYYGAGAPLPEGTVLTIGFELDGQHVVALNGGPAHKLSPAMSLVVGCKSQEEIDYYWERFSEGGREQGCGWITDRFGLSWQVVPENIGELFSGSKVKVDAAFQAMMGMKKLVIADLERARDAA